MSARVSEKIAEERIISSIKRSWPSALPKGIVGIGDDCAVIPFSKNNNLLISADALCEGVHFLREHVTPEDLGYKSLAVNLSDIAAMGGRPTYAFLSLCLPKRTSSTWVKSFLRGFSKLAKSAGVVLLGGDTCASKAGIFISITILGTCKTRQIKLRSSANPGDIICVTGNLGDSRAGLEFVLGGARPKAGYETKLLQRHYSPRPHLAEGHFLASQSSVSALMDVSDGLVCDVNKLVKASECSARIFLDQIPVSAELRAFCRARNIDRQKYAAGGGEDYCLLSCVARHALSKVQSKYKKLFRRELAAIGEVISARDKVVFYSKNGRRVTVEKQFKHF